MTRREARNFKCGVKHTFSARLRLRLHNNLVLRDSAEVFYEAAVNDNSAWKMIFLRQSQK